MSLTHLIKMAIAHNVHLPKAVFCNHHPLPVRRQYVIDAMREEGVVL